MNGVASGSLWSTVEARLERSTIMKWLEKRTKLNKKILLLIFSLSLICFVSVLIGKSFMINLVMFVCPVYHSYKALKTCDPLTMKRNLSYWVVLGSLSLIESCLYSIIEYIPLYGSIKVIFLFYCFLPSTNGAEKVLELLITPLLTPYESTLDYPMDAIASLDPSQLPDMPNITNMQIPNMQSMNLQRQRMQQQIYNYYYQSYGLNELDTWTQQSPLFNNRNNNTTNSYQNVQAQTIPNISNTSGSIHRPVNDVNNVNNNTNVIPNNVIQNNVIQSSVTQNNNPNINHLRQRNGHINHIQNNQNRKNPVNAATNQCDDKENVKNSMTQNTKQQNGTNKTKES